MNSHLCKHLEHSSAIEAEVHLLLIRILELTGVRAIASPVTYSRPDTRASDSLFLEEVVVELEHGGVQYRLVKSSPAACTGTTLSRREQEIVRLVSTGHPNKTIAHKLAISQHTVNTHVRRIFGKLGVSSRAEMVAYALQSGLVGQQRHYN